MRSVAEQFGEVPSVLHAVLAASITRVSVAAPVDHDEPIALVCQWSLSLPDLLTEVERPVHEHNWDTLAPYLSIDL